MSTSGESVTTGMVSVTAAEMQRLRDVAAEARGLLRAIRAEADPGAHLAESIITQHHMNRLAELL